MFNDILDLLDDITRKEGEFTRTQEVLIYTIDILNSMVDQGLLEGKAWIVSKKGLEMIKTMEEPTDEELETAMTTITAFINQGGNTNDMN